ncbi:MAG: glycosyl transferase family 28 [Chitinophagaceae bacterium]|nr:MAG: glycosyl transferase family 28 [Chitinophagaceae bacterium]
MIFVTTGTQEPFDRLLEVVKIFASNTDEKIVIQAKTKLQFPTNVEIFEFLSPQDFKKHFNEARLIVSHAGMGSIITALQNGKPIIIFPRIAAMGEHRNEHQMATAKKIKEQNLVDVTFTKDELISSINNSLNDKSINSRNKINEFASNSLLDSLDQFIKS